jgi:hypothetical protein
MKGLRKYIKKHGRHFTEELALAVTSGRWDSSEIMKKAQNIVYYNVTGSTVGDIVFLTNNLAGKNGKSTEKNRFFYRNRQKCVKLALTIVGDYSFRDGAVFNEWVGDTKDFDLTPFI